MNTAMSPRVRRGLAVGALAGLTLAVILGGVVPLLRDATDMSDARAVAHAEIARARSFARTGPALIAGVRELDAAPVWQQLLSGDSRSAVESQLFTEVRGYFDAGTQLNGVEPLPPISKDGLTRVGVRVQGTMTIDAVRHFIERVESAPHLLRIRALTLSAPPVQSALGLAQNESLGLRAEVYGWMRATEEGS